MTATLVREQTTTEDKYRWFRNRVLNHLEKIDHGKLTVVDPYGTSVFGNSHRDSLSATFNVQDLSVYSDLFWGGDLGFAEAYLQSKWATEDLTSLLQLFCRNMSQANAFNEGTARLRGVISKFQHWLSSNTVSGSKKNIAAHYDLSNEFFQLFLDPTMMYSSAYFQSPTDSLEQASKQKIDLICKKLRLMPSDHVIEIGTGWGGFAIHAAKEYGCHVTTTTISEQQYEFAARRIKDEQLEDHVTLLKDDYRNLEGQYDKAVSIEMIEAVGHPFLKTYFEKCCDLLKPGGTFLVQAITIPNQRYESYRRSVDFIQKYIFPGGHLPSIGAMELANTNTRFQMIESEDFGQSYALTLREWRNRFFDQIENVHKLGFDDSFIRKWDYYFCYCEAAFLEMAVGVSQIVWKKSNY